MAEFWQAADSWSTTPGHGDPAGVLGVLAKMPGFLRACQVAMQQISVSPDGGVTAIQHTPTESLSTAGSSEDHPTSAQSTVEPRLLPFLACTFPLLQPAQLNQVIARLLPQLLDCHAQLTLSAWCAHWSRALVSAAVDSALKGQGRPTDEAPGRPADQGQGISADQRQGSPADQGQGRAADPGQGHAPNQGQGNAVDQGWHALGPADLLQLGLRGLQAGPSANPTSQSTHSPASTATTGQQRDDGMVVLGQAVSCLLLQRLLAAASSGHGQAGASLGHGQPMASSGHPASASLGHASGTGTAAAQASATPTGTTPSQQAAAAPAHKGRQRPGRAAGTGRGEQLQDPVQQQQQQPLLPASLIAHAGMQLLSSFPSWGPALQQEALLSGGLLPTLLTTAATHLPRNEYLSLCGLASYVLLAPFAATPLTVATADSQAEAVSDSSHLQAPAPTAPTTSTTATAPATAVVGQVLEWLVALEQHVIQGCSAPQMKTPPSQQPTTPLTGCSTPQLATEQQPTTLLGVQQAPPQQPTTLLGVPQAPPQHPTPPDGVQQAPPSQQPTMPTGSHPRPLLREALLLGLQHPHSHARARAVHLLQGAWAVLDVPGCGAEQWEAFISIYRSQEERVMHLIQPVWQASYPVLWSGLATPSTSTKSPSPSGGPSPQGYAELVRWVGVLSRRCCGHSHAGVRHMGLMQLWSLPQPVMHALVQDDHAWHELQELLVSQLSALEHEKVVPAWSVTGSVTSDGSHSQGRQATQVLALRTTLAGCIRRCLAELSSHHGPAARQQQQQQLLLSRLLLSAVDVSQRAATAVLLLGALADAVSPVEGTHEAVGLQGQHALDSSRTTLDSNQAALDSSQTTLDSSHHMITLLLPLVERVVYLRPSCHVRHMHGALLRVLAACVYPRHVPMPALLGLLTACEPGQTLAIPTQVGSGMGQDVAAQPMASHRAVKAVQAGGPGVLRWLGAALVQPRSPPQQPLQGDGTGGVQQQQQQTPLGAWLQGILAPTPVPQGLVHEQAHNLIATQTMPELAAGDGLQALQHMATLAALLPHLPSSCRHVAARALQASGAGMATHGGGGMSDAHAACMACLCCALMDSSTTTTSATTTSTSTTTCHDSSATTTTTTTTTTCDGDEEQGSSAALLAEVAGTCAMAVQGLLAAWWTKQSSAGGGIEASPVGLAVQPWLSAAVLRLPPGQALVQGWGSELQGKPWSSCTCLLDQVRLLGSWQLYLTNCHQQKQQPPNLSLLLWLRQLCDLTPQPDLPPPTRDPHLTHTHTHPHPPSQQQQPLRRQAEDELQRLKLDCILAAVQMLHVEPPSAAAAAAAGSAAAAAAAPTGGASCCITPSSGGGGSAGPGEAVEVVAVKEHLLTWCMDQLRWIDPGTEAHSLQALLRITHLTAPFPLLPTTTAAGVPPPPGQPVLAADQQQQDRQQHQHQQLPQQEQQQQLSQQQQQQQLEQLADLLGLLPGLLRGATGAALPAAAVPDLVSLFFHPSLFQHPSLRRMLDERLIPLALTKGGPRLAVATMTHLTSKVLLPDSPLLQAYLPHLCHLLAFSLFSHTAPSSLASVAALRLDPSLTLLPRVILCDHLSRMAASGADPAFIQALVMRLLTIASGGALDHPTTSTTASTTSTTASTTSTTASGYVWLAARESGTASVVNSVRVACWQAVTLLAPHLQHEAAQQVLSLSWRCLLSAHQQGNIRPHVQLVVLALLVGSAGEQGVRELLMPALRAYTETKYQVVVSTVIVSLFYVLHVGPDNPTFRPIVQALLPWSLHHRHAIRVPVCVLLHVVLDKHGPTLWGPRGGEEAGADQLGAGDNVAIMQQVQAFLRDNSEMRVLRERQAIVQLDKFNLNFETSLAGVFGVREMSEGQEPDGDTDVTGLTWHVHVRDRLPMDLLSALPSAVKAVGRAARGTGATTTSTADTYPGGAAGPQEEEGEDGVDVQGGEETLDTTNTTNLGPDDGLALDHDLGSAAGQAPGRSGGVSGGPSHGGKAVFQQLRPQLASQQVAAARPRPDQAAAATAAGAGGASGMVLLGDEADGLAADVAAARQGGRGAGGAGGGGAAEGLIVVASLLDNVPNMAGLCRTCESLGVSSLVLPSRAIASSEAFKRQSVTSERWIRLQEVGPGDVAAFLQESRALGYDIVGVEQASGSVPLQSYQWPHKAVLLLGNEQNGVPAPLLPLLDACVEIPMLGLTRSLNAHVSGAMAVWEYTKQRRL